MKSLLKKYAENLVWFYSFLRYKIFISIVLSILVGFLDGLGISVFFPIFKSLTNRDYSFNLENLKYANEWFDLTGVSIGLPFLLGLLILLFALKGVFKFANDAYRIVLQQQLIRKIRLSVLKSINQVKFSYFSNTNAGLIQNTISGEIDRINESYASYFLTIEQILLLIIYLTFGFIIDFKFAILVCIGGFSMNLTVKIILKRTKIESTNFTKESNTFQSQVIQLVNNYKYLKSTSLLLNYSKKIENTIYNLENSRKKIKILNTIIVATREPLLIIIITGIIFFQIYALNGDTSTIFISLLFFYRALTALTSMQNAQNKFVSYYGSLENLKLFQLELKQNNEPVSKNELNSFKRKIEITDLNYFYGENKVLNNINLSIDKNQSIAIIGESGSGKTTLINIITGLLACNSGNIKVDGKNIKGLNLNSYQKRIGYISQEPVIFNATIFDNVSFWAEKSEKNIKRFNDALEQANAYSFIQNLALKENTLLGNNGINLSGGQRQRISIARELYKEVDILIMDEATSSLDSETEMTIQQNLDQLKGKYTIITIAHRLSTIKNTDEIVIMDKGNIVEKGSYNNLINSESIFRKMINLQKE